MAQYPTFNLPTFTSKIITHDRVARRFTFPVETSMSEIAFSDSILHHVIEMEAYVARETLCSNDIEVVEQVPYEHLVPATWWDHFKSEQVEATSPMWRWVARRWPARMIKQKGVVTVKKTFHFERKAMFPNAQMPTEADLLGQPFVVESATASPFDRV